MLELFTLDIFSCTFALYILVVCAHCVYQLLVKKSAPYLEIGLHASFVALIVRYASNSSISMESHCLLIDSSTTTATTTTTTNSSSSLLRVLLFRYPSLAIIGVAAISISAFYCGSRYGVGNAASISSVPSSNAKIVDNTSGEVAPKSALTATLSKDTNSLSSSRQPKIRLKVQNLLSNLQEGASGSGGQRETSGGKKGGSGNQSLAAEDSYLSPAEVTFRERRESIDGTSEYAQSVTSGDTNSFRKSDFNDQEFKEVFEAAKKSVVSIVNTFPEGVDIGSKWVLQQPSEHLRIWSAYSGNNGILLKGIATFNCSSDALAKCMIDNNIIMGVEPVFQSMEIIHKTDDITLTRAFCKQRTYYSSHRDFIIVSGVHASNDGGYIMAAKSFNRDEKYSSTKKRRGHIRGVLRGSGFMVRPKQVPHETELFIGIHLSMEGSKETSTRQWNLSKSEIIVAELSKTIQRIRTLVEKNIISAVIDKRVLSPIQSISSENEVVEISSDQKDQLMRVANDASVRMKALHNVILTSKSNDDGSSNNIRFWETLYDQNGIVVREQQPDSVSPLGVLNASCSIDAPLHIVQEKLMDQLKDTDGIDGLIENKVILCHLNSQVNIQWMAYRSMWPLGARDFLMITSNDTFTSPIGECFTIVSTSIDDICEMDAPASVIEKDYVRTLLKLAGYVGAPNDHGGTDLHLFLDINLSQYLPAWIIQMLAQYGLSEIMSRIRDGIMTQTAGRTVSPVRGNTDGMFSSQVVPPLTFDKLLSNIQHREEKLKKLINHDFGHESDDMPKPLLRRENSNTTTHNDNISNSSGSSNNSISSSSSSSSNDAVKVSSSEAGSSSSNSVVVNHIFPPEFDQFKPRQAPYMNVLNSLSDESISLFQAYAGLKQSSTPLALNWQQVASKKLATVWTSPVEGSLMSAIRCSAVIPNTSVIKLLKLLLNDDRMKEYDDMVDQVVFISNVNERARLARMVMKGIWPTSPRDFLCCTTWRVFPDGSVIIASRSPIDNSAQPLVDGFVRGSVHASGYLIQPSEAINDPSCPKGSVKITLQAHSELGGSLPTSIINKLSSAAPMNIINTIADIVSQQ